MSSISRYVTVSIPKAIARKIDYLIDEFGYWPSRSSFVREACLEKISQEERKLRELRGSGGEANQPERGVRPRRGTNSGDQPPLKGPRARINPGETITVVTSYHMDEETENWAQSGTMTFNIERILEVPSKAPSVVGLSLPSPPPSNTFVEDVPADQTGYVVDASDLTGTTVTLDTVGEVTVTVLRYDENPHPEDPLPATALPLYVDVEVSDPDAVVWPIYVEMSYTDEEAEGLGESTFGIYYWKDDAWQRCSDTGVDTERNIVWAYMTADEASGSPILMGGMPAMPTPPLPPFLDNLKITPAVIELGDNVTISLDIRNPDSQSITYIVTMRIGDLTLLVDVELGAYDSTTVSRTLTMDEVGVFNVTVDGMSGSFTVEAVEPEPGPEPEPEPEPLRPAEFKFSDLTIEPEEVKVGEKVTIRLRATNVGEEEGSYTVVLTMDDLEVDLWDITSLEGGDSTMVTFIIWGEEGVHTVEIDGLSDSFTVLTPPKPPFWLQPGYVAGIMIVIVSAVAIIYLLWKGRFPSIYSPRA